MHLRLRRFTPLPMLVQQGPVDPPIVRILREQGLRCLGPYHNDRWYVFEPRRTANENHSHLKGGKKPRG